MFRIKFIVLVASLVYLLTGIAEVRPEERAVVRRFGRIAAHPGPGLWIGLPWGIDQIDRVPVRTVRQLRAGYIPEANTDTPSTPAGQFLTGDQNLVNIQLVLDYAIGETDAELDDYVMHQHQVETILTRESEAAAAEWTGGRPVDEVLLTGNAALPLWLMTHLPERIALLRLGVRVQRVSVAYLAPPEEVRTAFEAVSQAQTTIRTKENQADQDARQRLRQAEAYGYKLDQDAEVFRASAIRQAQADAAEFEAQLQAYRDLLKSDPNALATLWWFEMRKTLSGLKARGGRIEPLDEYLGKDGLDITQFLTPRRR